MSDRTQNAKILLVVGLILVVGGVIGMIYQWSAYTEYAGSKPVQAVQGGPVTGAGGAFVRGITAWNENPHAKADQAMNMFIFMAIGCGLGVVCLYHAFRQPKAAEHEEAEDMRHHGLHMTGYWDKEPSSRPNQYPSSRGPAIPYYWEEETETRRHRRQPSSPSYWEDDGHSRIRRADPPAYWDEDERIKSQNPNYSNSMPSSDTPDRTGRR